MPESRTVTFTGPRGNQLAARLDTPYGTPPATVLFAHCFRGGNAGSAEARIARSLTELGMAVLSLDFNGAGSTGTDVTGAGDGPAGAAFSLTAGDLVAAAGLLRSLVAAPSILIGHSAGGAAVLAMAAEVPEVRAVVVLGTPAEGAEQRERIATLRRALLVVHSPDDEVVGIGNADAIFGAARHPKSFLSLDGADHLMTRPADAAYTAGVIAAWGARWLPARERAGSGATPAGPVPDGVVVVAESNAGPYGQRITAGAHQLSADEPAAIGGAGSGPTPYDLLLAGLGACTAMTIRMYAERKGWPLRHTTLRLRHGRIHAADCTSCDTKVGRIDHIERDVQFEGELTAEQRATLLSIAERCPVHRTLHSEVVIATTESVSGRSAKDPP